jgi:aspartate oxidase
MARYIDADTVVELIDQRIRIVETLYGANRTASLAILRSYVKGLPTADVAPRAEVAREIFEEIESTGKVYNGVFLYNRELTALKKKYTEDQT